MTSINNFTIERTLTNDKIVALAGNPFEQKKDHSIQTVTLVIVILELPFNTEHSIKWNTLDIVLKAEILCRHSNGIRRFIPSYKNH